MEIQSKEADSPCTTETKPQGIMAQVVVGIGSSAGGIEVLLDLIRVIPERSSQAFLLCQHLSPGYKSLLPELISRYTKHSVQEAFDGAPLLSGAFYLVPSRYFMTICRGRIRLRERKKSDPQCFYPIDQLFKSLAVDYGEAAIAVVLSGTGSDGVDGALEVRRRGGHVIIQEIGSAIFQGMPQNVKNSAAAPLELSIQKIPSQIEKITRRMTASSKPTYVESDPHFVIDRILAEVRSRFETDFFSYDVTQIREKIKQRLLIVGVQDLEQYLKVFKANQVEQESLYHELRSRNLEFYSHPDSLDRLRQLVFPLLAEECKQKSESVIRVWVLGCGSGEETYTIAFMLQDFIDEHKLDLSFKIFSTDLDLNSINFARVGIYPMCQVRKLPEPWLQKYFTIDGDRALVQQSIWGVQIGGVRA